MTAIPSYHEIRKYLKKTGVELITYEQCKKTYDDMLAKENYELEKIKRNRIKDSPLTRGEGFSFELIDYLRKTKTKKLTTDQIKSLQLKRLKAEEKVVECYKKWANEAFVLGKGIKIKQSYKDEERNDHTLTFERLKQLIQSRNNLDTWLLHKEHTEIKKYSSEDLKGKWKYSVAEVIDAKKQQMWTKTKNDLLSTINARIILPTIAFHY